MKQRISDLQAFPYLTKYNFFSQTKPSMLRTQSIRRSTSRKKKAKTSSLPPIPPPPFQIMDLKQQLTSPFWIILDLQNNKTFGSFISLSKQIASLTKIMTCIIGVELMNKFQLDLSMKIKVNKSSSSVGGTSASLVENSWVRLEDLFYGMMLPSGNDASLLLSEVFGFLVSYQNLHKLKDQAFSDIQQIDLTTFQDTEPFRMKFIKLMNKKAQVLRMSNTRFENVHGLGTRNNKSSANDLSILCKYCLENQLFTSIVSTKEHLFRYTLKDEQQEKLITWKNTNKLLEQGWVGLKTGQTPSAGACLASCRDGVIIVVLNSSSLDARFEDTIKIFESYRGWKRLTQ